MSSFKKQNLNGIIRLQTLYISVEANVEPFMSEVKRLNTKIHSPARTSKLQTLFSVCIPAHLSLDLSLETMN